jgi:hypothetical protein
MDPVTGWTGRTACALQAALRLSNEAFAERLGIGVRTVAAWHQKPSLRPRPEMQQVLDTALGQATSAIKARFAALVSDSAPADVASRDDAPAADPERRLTTDPNIGAALDRLDQYAGWQPGVARRQVASQLARLDVGHLQDRAGRRRRIGQRQVAEALGSYYRGWTGGHGRYSARYGQDSEVVTSVLTHPGWLDLDCPLTTACDRLTLTSRAADGNLSLDEQAAHAAAQRLAETLATGTRLVDMPLYRLLHIDVTEGAIRGLLGSTQFVRYALTMDLLEGELLDGLTADVPARPGYLPLRDQYLSDPASVLGVARRLCAGGTLALCAIARPTSPYRGLADLCCLSRSAPARSLTLLAVSR